MSTDDKILSAAARIFEEVGFRATTTRAIAAEAGVNEVTLFRHFGSKERLLLAAVKLIGERDPVPPLPGKPSAPLRELSAWCHAHLTRLHQARHVLAAAMSERAQYPEVCAEAGEGPAKVHGELVLWLEGLRSAGLASGRWDAAQAASMLMGALFATAVGADLHDQDPPFSAELAVAHYVPLFLRGLGVEECG